MNAYADSSQRLTMRDHLWRILHDGRGRIGQAVNFLLIVLVMLSVAIIPLEFLPSFPEFRTTIHGIETVVVLCFAVEYILRLYSAPRRLRYAFSFAGIVDLLSIVPFYALVFGNEYVRLFRLIRFFKILEIEAAAEKDEESAVRRGIGLVEGERVELVVAKSPIILFLGIIPSIVAMSFGLAALLLFNQNIASIIAAGLLLLFAIVFIWKTWLDFGYDVIYLTNFRLIFHNRHLLGRSINQVAYASITNVKPFYPSLISYVLRYGSLIIDTAAEHPGQIGLHTVRSHEYAAQQIMAKCFVHRPPQATAPVANTPQD